MRPVTRGSPRSYAPPATLRFVGASGTKIQAVMGTNQPTMAACLDVWLRVVKARKRKPAPTWFKDWDDAAKLIQARVEEIYKEAAEDLIIALGEYCSYCESPISGLLEVEHVLAKAEFPTFAAKWDNFLLACGACNNCKGNTPHRRTVQRWLATKLTNETQCEAEVRTRYSWPDINSNTFRDLPVELICDAANNGNWQLVAFADATDLRTRLVSVDIPSRTVRADLPSQNLFDVRVIARVVPLLTPVTISGVATAVIPPGAQAIIDLCGLNTTASSRVAYDRRGLHRTRAWFNALDWLSALQPSPTPADFDRTWSQVGNAAAGIGFFSVWLRVFSSATDYSGRRLDDRFVMDYAQLFPGTNTTSLP
jgi:5-methylcytosine-specific restriction endonuclease McrA